MQKLATARLVVTSGTFVSGETEDRAEQETVEVVHEALIRNWGKLQEWMETDRDFRTWQERLRGAIGQWEEMKKDEAQLWRGAALLQAQEKLKERGEELSPAEEEFIGLSQELQTKERKQKQRQQQQIFAGLITFSVCRVRLG